MQSHEQNWSISLKSIDLLSAAVTLRERGSYLCMVVNAVEIINIVFFSFLHNSEGELSLCTLIAELI